MIGKGVTYEKLTDVARDASNMDSQNSLTLAMF